MKNNPFLLVQLEDNEVAEVLEGLLKGQIIVYAGFKCRVHEINIKEEGSKQLGTHRIVASACLLLVESYEIN